MKATDVNAVLSFVVMFGGCLAFAVWMSPRALDWAVAHMYARSRALAAARRIYRDAYREAFVSCVPAQTIDEAFPEPQQ